jgi:hypothetical protein
MTATVLFVAASVLLPAIGLVTWAWFVMAQVEDDLRAFSGFEGMNFEIGTQAAQATAPARWPVPG